MSALLTDPTVVLVLSDDGDRVGTLRDVLGDGDATAVEGYASLDDVRDRLEDTYDVGSVVVTDDVPDLDVAEACREIREIDELLPVVAYVEDGDEALAAAVTRAGGDGYVPASEPDATLRDVADDALTEYERRRTDAEDASILATILDELETAIYAKDTEGRHVRSAKILGGYSAGRLRGQTDLEVSEYVDAEAAREAYEDDMRVIEEETGIYDKQEHHDFHSNEHYYRTTKVPWYGKDGELRGLVGLSWNVTDYVHQEQRLEQQEERIDKFASYVSHDLRSPLQVATGALELARETGDDDALEKVADALERIDDIIADLSALAKQGRATTTFEVDETSDVEIDEPTDLVELVDEVWAIVQSGGASLNVEFGAGAIVNAPETSLRPIFENLFVNAVTHGGADVTVRVGPLESGGFFVEDDGPGIPVDERDRVLEPGYTTADDGTGTGLSIVSETVARHNWDLVVTESETGGARFEVHNALLVPQPDLDVEAGDAVELADDVDVGETAVEGDATYDDVVDRWTVSGAGSNIWRQDNDFHFVYAAVDGPVSIRGRVVELEDRSDYSKAGLMVRDDLDEDAPYGFIGITPEHGTELLWRNDWGDDGISQHLANGSLAYSWYRVDRVGETVTTWLSPDGQEWHPVDQREVAVEDPVYVGLVVCSFTPNRLCEAVFENVQVNRLDQR